MSPQENVKMDSMLLELKQNFRLRMGIWLIVFIVLLYLVLVQSARFDEAFSQYNRQALQLERAETLLGQDDWVTRAELENTSFSELSGRLWQAETLGLAQASLQGALNSMAQSLTLRNIRLRSGAAQAIDTIEGVWQVQVQLDAQYNAGDELGLLYKMAQNSQLMVVERFDLQPNNQRLSMIVSGYFTGLQVEIP